MRKGQQVEDVSVCAGEAESGRGMGIPPLGFRHTSKGCKEAESEPHFPNERGKSQWCLDRSFVIMKHREYVT